MKLEPATARTVMLLMVSASDHITGLAGLTLTLTLSKNGGVFASIAPAVTDRGSGWYAIQLTAAMTDTPGDLCLHATATGADPTDRRFDVEPLAEAGLTLRNAIRLIAAATAGELAGAGTTTITLRNAVADTRDRVTATVDSAGNRIALTYDLGD